MTTALAFFLIVLALVGAARVAELLHARRLTRQARARGAQPQREPAFVAMVLLHTVPFWAAPLEVALLDRPFLPWLAVVATTLLGIAAVVRVWTLRTLGARWNVRIVAPDAIVTTGPYAFVRHPNYAVVVTELFALPLVHGAWITCAVCTIGNALVLLSRIPAEERVLFAQEGYAAAMGGKPRFLPFTRAASIPPRA